MTGDRIIRKTGSEMKQEILGMLYDHIMELQNLEYESALDDYLKKMKIEFLREIHNKVLEISLIRNGGDN